MKITYATTEVRRSYRRPSNFRVCLVFDQDVTNDEDLMRKILHNNDIQQALGHPRTPIFKTAERYQASPHSILCAACEENILHGITHNSAEQNRIVVAHGEHFHTFDTNAVQRHCAHPLILRGGDCGACPHVGSYYNHECTQHAFSAWAKAQGMRACDTKTTLARDTDAEAIAGVLGKMDAGWLTYVDPRWTTRNPFEPTVREYSSHDLTLDPEELQEDRREAARKGAKTRALTKVCRDSCVLRDHCGVGRHPSQARYCHAAHEGRGPHALADIHARGRQWLKDRGVNPEHVAYVMQNAGRSTDVLKHTYGELTLRGTDADLHNAVFVNRYGYGNARNVLSLKDAQDLLRARPRIGETGGWDNSSPRIPTEEELILYAEVCNHPYRCYNAMFHGYTKHDLLYARGNTQGSLELKFFREYGTTVVDTYSELQLIAGRSELMFLQN